MGKRQFKPGNMLHPVPAVMVSVADKEGNANIITVAWAGTVCTNPPMLTISVRPERYSYHMIQETGEFVVNLTTERSWPGLRTTAASGRAGIRINGQIWDSRRKKPARCRSR